MGIDLEKALALAKEKLEQKEQKEKPPIELFFEYFDRDYTILEQQEDTYIRKVLPQLAEIVDSYPDISKQIDVYNIAFLDEFKKYAKSKGFRFNYHVPRYAGLLKSAIVKNENN